MAILRRTGTFLGGAAATVALGIEIEHAAAIAIPVSLLALSIVLSQRKHFGGQLFARAVWWANLVLGFFLATSGVSSERPMGALLALGCGAALLFSRDFGMSADLPSGKFQPVAFRGSLLLSMILALADAQTLLFFGALSADSWHAETTEIAALFACSALMIVSLVGLYRMKVAAVVATIVANVLVATLALMGVLGLDREPVTMLVSTAVLQLFVPIPLIVGMVRGKAPAAPPRAMRHVVDAALVLIAAVSAVAGFA